MKYWDRELLEPIFPCPQTYLCDEYLEVIIRSRYFLLQLDQQGLGTKDLRRYGSSRQKTNKAPIEFHKHNFIFRITTMVVGVRRVPMSNEGLSIRYTSTRRHLPQNAEVPVEFDERLYLHFQWHHIDDECCIPAVCQNCSVVDDTTIFVDSRSSVSGCVQEKYNLGTKR